MKYKVKYCTGEAVEIDSADLIDIYINGDKKPVFSIDRINTCDHECEFHSGKEKINPS
jgi:hypothetical protein